MVELGDEQVRPARRRRRTIRRPRHRQARGVRARRDRRSTSTSTRPRSTSSATPTSRSSARSRGCSELERAPPRRFPAGPKPWLRQIGHGGAVPAPLRRRRRPVLKPQPVLRDAAGADDGRDDVVWTTGVGQHQMCGDAVPALRPAPHVHHLRRARHDGLRPSAAVGAKAARPDATVVCIDGDGCFQMTCQELATSVSRMLPRSSS